MKKIWLPALCAFLIAGLVYFIFGRGSNEEKLPTVDQFGNEFSVVDTKSDVQKPVVSNGEVEGPNINQVENNSNNNQKIMSATLHTNKGDITIEFNPNTPNTAENFIKLAKTGFYDGTKFHRVIKGFMNQGGDPLSKDDSMMARWGTGGPGYQFADEIGADNRNAPGTIAMANSGPNTNGSQFFINAADNAFLDTKHTVFGKVTAGADVVVAINNTETGENDRPVESVVIESVTLK